MNSSNRLTIEEEDDDDLQSMGGSTHQYMNNRNGQPEVEETH